MTLVKEYNSIINQRVGITNFLNIFSDENECLELYFTIKFSGCSCEKCGRSVVENYARIGYKKAFRCRSCHTYIYPLSETIFRKSPLPLRSIFFLIFCFGSFKSMSAVMATKHISITYKTAHRLMMLLRKCLYNANRDKMRGVVEIDEAFFGGGNKVYNWSAISTRKQPIIGMLERETGQARMFLVDNRSAATINSLILDNVELGATIYTDSWRGYKNLSKYYTHETVDHSKREFVRGNVYTNNIEGLWGKFKRNIRKSHIKITDKYVHLYATEMCWRHNNKNKSSMELFNDVLLRTMRTGLD